MFTSDLDNDEPFLRPSFSTRDKIRRLTWSLTWTILCRWTPAPLHAWRAAVLRLFGARLGQNNHIYPNCRIWAPWLLQTEDIVTIGPGVEVYNPGGIYMGHHSILSQDAYVCGATHDYNNIEFTYLKRRVVIGPYVWICAKAIVLPGVHCGEGAVLGAASVTSRNLEPWSVYAGNPARRVKARNNFLKESKEKEDNAQLFT